MRRNSGPFWKDQTLQFTDHFVYAGTSALVLSLAHIHPAYWFLSFFALLPFLWRLNRVNLSGSIIAGIILGGCYASVAFIDQVLVSPWTFLLRLFVLCLIFSAFGAAVNRIKRYIGFHPIFIASLWLPLEYALTHYAHLSSIFTFPEIDSALLIRIGSLFGILMVSFAVVLMNSLILILLKHVVQALRSPATFPLKEDKRIYPLPEQIQLQRHWYRFAQPRAPPSPKVLSILQRA